MTAETLDDSMQRRLAWRCRRGMLELDIVLQKFVAERFFSLTNEELAELDQLLDLPDNDFWALLSHPSRVGEKMALQSLLSKIRAQ